MNMLVIVDFMKSIAFIALGLHNTLAGALQKIKFVPALFFRKLPKPTTYQWQGYKLKNSEKNIQ